MALSDNLAGTAVYSAANWWSIRFDDIPYDKFLFTRGDSKDQLRPPRYNNLAVQTRSILRSSVNPTAPTSAGWYQRTTAPEDPWVSARTHNVFSPANQATIVYVPAHPRNANQSSVR
eukprot:2634723-Rhodomonas_salina.3